MKVILFGATGLAGNAILTELLAAGYFVTAFVRTPAKIQQQHAVLTLIEGDVLNAQDVTQAIKGHEAVISAISEGPQIVQHTQSRGVAQIIKAMQQHNLHRLIAMGSFGILQLNETQLVRDVDYPEAYYPISEEQFKVYQQLQKSNLQWTQVCPPMILDEPADQNFVTEINYPPKGKNEINAGNLGAFIAGELKQNHFLQTRVGIANN